MSATPSIPRSAAAFAVACACASLIAAVPGGAQVRPPVERPRPEATEVQANVIRVTTRQTGPTEITVTWNPVPDAQSYVLERHAQPDGWARVTTPASAATRYVDHDVHAGRAYRYQVSAVVDGVVGRPFSSDSVVVAHDVAGAAGAGVTEASKRDTARGDAPRGAGARYRVTLNGLTVLRQTYDHLLQIDGKGDEIYFAAWVAMIDTTKSTLAEHWVVRSRDMGDVNGFPQRVRLGSLSGQGGIKTGDKFPLGNPYRRQGTAAPDSLPMLLFEGELTQGSNVVLISPTVWEWDDNPELFGYWVVSRELALRQLTRPDVVLAALNNRRWFPVDLGAPGFRITTNMFGDPRDRPIGMETGRANGGFTFISPQPRAGTLIPQAIVEGLIGKLSQNLTSSYSNILRQILEKRSARLAERGTVRMHTLPVDGGTMMLALDSVRARTEGSAGAAYRPPPFVNISSAVVRSTLTTELYFFDKVLALTPQAIEDALQLASKVSGRPAGAIDVAYTDFARLEGRYILHLQVERLP